MLVLSVNIIINPSADLLSSLLLNGESPLTSSRINDLSKFRYLWLIFIVAFRCLVMFFRTIYFCTMCVFWVTVEQIDTDAEISGVVFRTHINRALGDRYVVKFPFLSRNGSRTIYFDFE